MKTKRYIKVAFCLMAALCMTTGCKDEDKPVSQVEEPRGDVMDFSLSVDTRAGYSAESVTAIENSFWLMVEISGNVAYNGEASVINGMVELDQGATLEWPSDKSEKVNIFAIYHSEGFEYNPVLVNVPQNNDYNLGFSHFCDYEYRGDLLVAHCIVSHNDCKSGVVNLNFKHALTGIRTAMKLTDSRYFYSVKNISVMAVPRAAYYFSPVDTLQDKWISYYEYVDSVAVLLDKTFGEGTAESIIEEGGYLLEEMPDVEATNYSLFDPYDETTGNFNLEYDLGTVASFGSDYNVLLNKESPKQTPLQTFIIPLDNLFSLEYALYSLESGGANPVKGTEIRTISCDGLDLNLDPTSKNQMITLQATLSGNSITLGGVDKKGREMD